jgi:hypothetical protein
VQVFADRGWTEPVPFTVRPSDGARPV